ncbi:MAG: dihydroorotase [Clostridia bacterium]|nr:dihydroorotase [Clostridia bacterium]
MRLLIKNGHVVDPKNGVDEVRDILIADGIIQKTGANLTDAEATVLDATGKIVAPGLVDLHVHFREPGLEYKEDIETGSRAAAKGGVTTVVCMPNTDPVIDNGPLVQYVMNRGKEVGLVNVLTTGCISKGQKSGELSEIGELKAAGAVGISDDGRPVLSSSLMRKALEYAKMFDIPVLSHCEDLDLVDGGSMNEGYMSTFLGLRGIPKAAESVAVTRDILIAEEVEGRLHVCHVSTRNAIEAVREAKKRGVKVTAETAPHYFTLTDKACDGFNTNAKMNPPLRDEDDVQAVIEGLIDGTLDAIATDHAPHHRDEKELEFDQASNGIVGLETSLALGVTYLVKTGKLTMSQLIEKMSVNPAEIIGFDRGSLAEGKVADVVIFDAEEEFTVNVNDFASKGKNSPYDGFTLTGQVETTITGGKIVYQRA